MIDDGTVSRLEEQTFRWTAADPSLRWFRQNAAGLDVQIEDISEAGRGAGAAGADLRAPAPGCGAGRHRQPEILPRDHAAPSPACPSTSRAPATPAISATRSGCRPTRALTVWDALIAGGRPFDIKPAGMLALDVARIEAGSAADRRRFLQQPQGDDRVAEVLAVRDGAGPARQPRQGARSSASSALREEQRRGPARQIVGLEIDWNEVEALYDAVGLAPAVAATASRVAVPVYRDGRQVGKATSTTWSPVLKKMIALATVDRPHYAEGTDAADRDDGRGRPPPRRRDGGEDAVLQPAAKDGSHLVPSLSPSSSVLGPSVRSRFDGIRR